MKRICTILISCLAVAPEFADEPIPTRPGVFVDPKDAGPDYLLQGEYLGNANSQLRTINLQNHGNPVVYRNIWYVPGK